MCIIYMLTDIIYHCIISNLTILEIVTVFFSRELIKYITVRKYSGKDSEAFLYVLVEINLWDVLFTGKVGCNIAYVVCTIVSWKKII